MPHDHHHHHDHPAHPHAGHRENHAAIAASLVGASAVTRLGLAAIAIALVWAGVFWAMA